jgi:hypothetical protein
VKKLKIKRSILRRVIAEEQALSRRTGHAITPRYVISALKQRGHLHEAEAEQIPIDQEERGDSIDRQVDRYLADYEHNSKTDNEPAEQMEWRDLVRSMVLAEAPGDEEGDEAEPEGPPEGGDEEAPAEEPEIPEKPPKLGLDDIDVELFANDVARMIENYDNLLEVRRTLIRRSINFISKNYDEQTVKELKYALRDNHGLMSDKSEREHKADDFQAPYAGEAGPGGA